LGIDYAKNELLFILNSDVQLTENYFRPLLKYFEIDDTFGVMGKIVSLEGDEVQDTAKYPQYSYAKIVTTKNYYTKSQNLVYSFILSGANSLVSRKKMIELGKYNELFNPYYFEDADLGLTAWRSGYKLYYEEEAVCRHSGSETVKKQTLNKVKLIAIRNRILLHYLHLNGIELFIFFLRTLFKTSFKVILFDRFYLKAFISFFNSYKEYSEYKSKYRIFEIDIRDIVQYIKSYI
jgi:GT2 family glycosyltransferase